MKKLASLIKLFCCILVITIGGCYENSVTPNRTTTNATLNETIANKTIFGREGELPEGIPESNSWRYPYPDIIEREFIPPNRLFAHTKCLAWRITWPEYEESADENKIPTVFAMNGLLTSFKYLNSIDPQNTHNTVFSLYYNNKVEASSLLWAELYHADVSLMEAPLFVLGDQPIDNIIDWVTERPDLFKHYWPGGGTNDLDYSEGDFIQYKLTDAQLFGGIRIVSMSPRIIEVYLAVPNY